MGGCREHVTGGRLSVRGKPRR